MSDSNATNYEPLCSAQVVSGRVATLPNCPGSETAQTVSPKRLVKVKQGNKCLNVSDGRRRDDPSHTLALLPTVKR